MVPPPKGAGVWAGISLPQEVHLPDQGVDGVAAECWGEPLLPSRQVGSPAELPERVRGVADTGKTQWLNQAKLSTFSSFFFPHSSGVCVEIFIGNWKRA